ncbi:hypothetical protein [Hwanghaeella grinnelliae]|nr:hypothetical protein [Hwanghaeella grinnelliae]
MAFFAILWYPVKRIMKKRKAAKQAVATDPAVDDDTKGADKP